MLQGIPNIAAYLKDILITGRNDKRHSQNLEAVLIKLDDAGLRLKMLKCSFMTVSVEYLGHHIDNLEISPRPVERLQVELD